MKEKSEHASGFEVRVHKCTIHMLDGHTITGHVNIGTMRRLSEVFTQDDSPFVTIYDATIGDGSRKRTFFLNKSAIAWAEPEKAEQPEGQ